MRVPTPDPHPAAICASEALLPVHAAQRKMPAAKGNGHLTLYEVSLLLVTALVAGLTKQLAVLLLGHTLATLLNN